jgi:hypothetical protein
MIAEMRRLLAVVAIALAACGSSDDNQPIVGPADLAFPPPVPDLSGCPLPVGFGPMWVPPYGPHTGACSSAELDTFISMVTQSGAQALETFMMQDPQCGLCLGRVNSVGSVATGSEPFVARPTGVLDANVGGCVELLDGQSNPQSCGAQVQARDDCLATACQSCVTVRIAADLVGYDKCLSFAAQMPECASYVAQAACLDQDAPAAKCRSTAWPSTGEWLRFLAELFCGTPGDL